MYKRDRNDIIAVPLDIDEAARSNLSIIEALKRKISIKCIMHFKEIF